MFFDITTAEVVSWITKIYNSSFTFATISVFLTAMAIIGGVKHTIEIFRKIFFIILSFTKSRKYHIPYKWYPKINSFVEMRLWFEFLDNPNKNLANIRYKKLNIENEECSEAMDIFYKSLSQKDRMALKSLIAQDALVDYGCFGNPNYSGFRAVRLHPKYTYIDFVLTGKCRICNASISISAKQFKTQNNWEDIQVGFFPKKEQIVLSNFEIGGAKIHDCNYGISLDVKNIVFGQLQ